MVVVGLTLVPKRKRSHLALPSTGGKFVHVSIHPDEKNEE